ncbi:MAG: metallophosphoesterase [Desulfobulbaceae bacterium]|nr:metallophosphoesterase [Desulfobulbaceae bacterium]
MKIIAFGDIHMDLGNLADIPGFQSADLILITGDLTNFGGRDDAARVLTTIRSLNNNILAVAGNLDQPEVNRYLQTEGISLHGNGILHDKLGIFGVGGSNPTPFKTPNEFSEQEIEQFLAQGFSQTTKARHRIVVSHPPPFATKTDRLQNNSHVGSKTLRAFIEQQQPDLCLTGHIHEARGVDHIGRTTIINPGMLKAGGWIAIEYDGDTITADLRNRA